MQNLHQLIYKCPHCGEEFKMVSDNNSLSCPSCGYKLKMDNYYNLIDKDGNILDITPANLFDNQRNDVKKEILDDNFYLEDEVEIGFFT